MKSYFGWQLKFFNVDVYGSCEVYALGLVHIFFLVSRVDLSLCVRTSLCAWHL